MRTLIYFGILNAVLVAMLIGQSTDSHAQTGGPYDLSRNLVGGGGGRSAAGTLEIEGSVGEPASGQASAANGISVRSGFWSFGGPLAPTAATVGISGRVTTSGGHGIKNVEVLLISPSGEVRRALSAPFGFFRFENVMSGQSYIVTVTARQHVFNNPTRIIDVEDELTGVDFTAEPF